ncbi:ABC transporter ATP-binding protein [uncultured Thiodictyon sp.]|jgi:cobalt/nickel transport system ATP-binding protein|uniref:energy-coupling factor ABC transporter ATP-binding protein n=1 Tax=uncultured Thiodictyon sp. TaxID=1846217 RepID=UPI0025E25389|nr:ABC transporter ATP-binding protein [uncultured Thiodictyon sp.]
MPATAAHPHTAAAFELVDVHYAYQDIPALNGVSLRIPTGQCIALLGANGSGKSTLLRLLAALCFPDRGRLAAFGEELSDERMQQESLAYAFRRRVGLVFQNPDVQLFNPTVFDELAFGPLQLGWTREEILRCVDAMLAEFSLADLKHRSPHRLSGGEKKRVALACVLITRPEVLLLDEPTAALDPRSQGEVVRCLAGCRGSGRTVVTATHNLDIVAEIADYCFVLQAGRLVAQGTSTDILGDGALLRATQLLHAHWHVHADGLAHTHDHRHHVAAGEPL